MFGEHRRKTRSQLEQEFLELDFTSDFLFSELMKDEELCRKGILTTMTRQAAVTRKSRDS